jgi:protein tyrosine phosphatase (PTP) superfamily phosphohydrolase (DUF442 family)
MKTTRFFTVVFSLFMISTLAYAEPAPRPEHWAKPLDLPGVPNFHKVSDQLYRSAQPTKEGMENLKKFGIETIINLRSIHPDRKKVAGTGLAYEHIYMQAWHPEEEEAVRFLQIVTNPRRTPVLVHCQHGADRTGAMCAIYRVAVQRWRKEDAIREMLDGGFGFHAVWKNLLRWINRLDIDRIKKNALGVNQPATIGSDLNSSHPRQIIPASHSLTRDTIIPLPKKGEEVPLPKIKDICQHYALHDLWQKIAKNPPPLPFQSDGCSLWFDTWRGIDLYPACFLHDLKYWAGYSGEDVERLIADAELMIDVARLQGSTAMAETMFHGVRPGGHEMFKQSFSWGFGRVQK